MSKQILLFLTLGMVFTSAHSQQGALTDYERILENIFYSDYQFAEMNVDSITTEFQEKYGRRYFVYYTSRGYKMRAEYDSRLIWQLTYVYVPFSKLPSTCKSYVTENYLNDGFNTSSIRYQDAPDDSYYKVDVKRRAEHFS